MEELTLDNVFSIAGELYVQNYRLQRSLEKLTKDIERLTKECNALRAQVASKTITVEPAPIPEGVSEAA